MNSNWIAALGLLAAVLSGCRSVPQPLETADSPSIHGEVVTGNLSQNPETRGSDPGGPRIGNKPNSLADPEIESGHHLVRQVGFLQTGSDINGPESPEPTAASAIVEVANGNVGSSNQVAQLCSLADLEQLAMSNNPALAAANAAVAKSKGLFRQVGVGPNPTVGYSGSQLADQGTDQHTVFVEQEFVRGNKLALNRQVLRHTTEAQRLEIETQCYRVLTDVRVRFYEAMAAQRQLEATVEFARVARLGVEVATQLQEAGESTAVDVLLSKTLLSETDLAKEKAEVEFRGAWTDLLAIAGIPDLQPVRLVGDFDSFANVPDWSEAYAEIMAESPELAAANAIVWEKRALLRRQEAQAIPNVGAQIGAGYDRATDSGLINLQVGVPIPVRNKNCGNITAARADYIRAVENVKRIELAIKSRLARVAQDFETADVSVRKYEQEIIPQSKENLELSEKAYRAGELAFLQVLTVRRSYYESRIRYIQSQGQLAQASAMLDGLLLAGGLDAPQDYTSGDGLRGQTLSGQ